MWCARVCVCGRLVDNYTGTTHNRQHAAVFTIVVVAVVVRCVCVCRVLTIYGTGREPRTHPHETVVCMCVVLHTFDGLITDTYTNHTLRRAFALNDLEHEPHQTLTTDDDAATSHIQINV